MLFGAYGISSEKEKEMKKHFSKGKEEEHAEK